MTKRYLLIALGWLCIVLGVIGIFLPILPTTPFILLAAWAFSRSSERFHRWLVNHPQLGPIVSAWQDGAGIPRKVRNRVILLLWGSLFCSSLIMGVMGHWWPMPILAIVGAFLTHYLLRQPLLEESDIMSKRSTSGADI